MDSTTLKFNFEANEWVVRISQNLDKQPNEGETEIVVSIFNVPKALMIKCSDQKVRAHYHKFLNINSDTLAWMMGMDAAFLLEFPEIYAAKEDEMLISMLIGLYKEISPFEKIVEKSNNIDQAIITKRVHLLDFLYRAIVPDFKEKPFEIIEVDRDEAAKSGGESPLEESSPLAFTRYTELMNGIIDTQRDAKFLREKGIIVNQLKSDKEVADLWNGMSKSIK
ncbi:hypothetical protein ACH5RR_008248 [Cinchona calisaya]|uniref:Uncharacterized protein n=1 Tax=Cinchona calisaya TaxID=153742 RepID=A0ABD3ADD6_9GENT